MGKISNSINHYLSDNRRFADLFNGICFQGETVVHAEDLSENKQVYYGMAEEPEKTGQSKKLKGRKERFRDICKKLKSGETLRVLALENQQMIDYTMPFRCMQYDVMEYGKQLDALKKQNRQGDCLENMAEKMCGIKKTDRLALVYTICLYHGTETWDGPRTLEDMMNFGDEDDSFQKIFKDYPMHLYCLNEERDLEFFHTEVGLLFQALQYRGDRAGLKKLMEQDERYKYIDVDTLETMTVMLDLPSIWKERVKYMEKNEDEEEYNMCQAIREWAEEERSIGRAEGRDEGRREGKQAGIDEKTRIIVRNMLIRGMEDADIMAIAECDQEFLDKVKMNT